METIPTRLVDNHTIIDPVEALIPGRNTAHDALRKQFRGLASEALKNTNEDGLVIILAACLAAGSSRAREHFQEYVELATARGEPLVVGRVVCDESANKKRVCSEERKKKGGGGGGGETKLAADKILAEIRKEHTLLEVKSDEWRIFPFKMDTTNRAVGEATNRIFEFLPTKHH